jgi:hypothetical protein
LATDLRYAEALGDRRQFRVGEQIGQRQFQPQLLTHLRDHARPAANARRVRRK